MKNILLISDTHGYFDEKLLKYIKEADEVWHAGDIGNGVSDIIQEHRPLRAVSGNIDDLSVTSVFPEDLIFHCENLKVWITHIGGYPGKYPAKIRQKLKEERPGLFICGHSHVLKVIYDKEYDLLHINPGAAGNHGFHQVKTAVRFSVEGPEIKNMSVIELGKRSSVI